METYNTKKNFFCGADVKNGENGAGKVGAERGGGELRGSKEKDSVFLTWPSAGPGTNFLNLDKAVDVTSCSVSQHCKADITGQEKTKDYMLGVIIQGFKSQEF